MLADYDPVVIEQAGTEGVYMQSQTRDATQTNFFIPDGGIKFGPVVMASNLRNFSNIT